MNPLEQLDALQAKPPAQPFKDEKDFADAMKRLFTTKEGRMVLQQLKYEMGYYAPDLPAGKDVGMQLAFNAGKRYVLNHIDSAMVVEYTTTNEEEND